MSIPTYTVLFKTTYFKISETNLTKKRFTHIHNHNQKQPCRGLLKKSCSKNMPKIYRRAAMPKCEFAAYFQKEEDLWTAASE